MIRFFFRIFITFSSTIFLFSCASDDNGTTNPPSTATENNTQNLGCSNVVIFNGFAYATCRNQLQIVELASGNRNTITIAANDIAIDLSNQTLFIQNTTQVHALSLENPMEPTIISSINANLGLFSGIAAANGVIIISGGTTNSNTQIFTFNNNQLVLATNGINEVDQVTGNPDVHATPTSSGIKAFYSQDLGAVSNWGIRIVDFDTNGNVTTPPSLVTLTPGRFTGGFSTISPANFPVESEFLNNTLYVAHFAINGIEVIDLNNNTIVNQIPLGYRPINITTDGTSLFVVGSNSNQISTINPENNTVNSITVNNIQNARGIAVSQNYFAIADQTVGLIIRER